MMTNVTLGSPEGHVTTKVAGSKVTGSVGSSKPANQGNLLPLAGQENAPAASAPRDSTAQQEKHSAEDLQNLVNQANSFMPARNSNLKFTVAEGTDINIVRVEDTETGELIRQIPSKEMVAVAQALQESIQGTMLQEKA